MATRAVVTMVNVCIWGFALVMTSHRLSGKGAYQRVRLILGGCAAASLLVVGLGAIRKPEGPEGGQPTRVLASGRPYDYHLRDDA